MYVHIVLIIIVLYSLMIMYSESKYISYKFDSHSLSVPKGREPYVLHQCRGPVDQVPQYGWTVCVGKFVLT